MAVIVERHKKSHPFATTARFFSCFHKGNITYPLISYTRCRPADFKTFPLCRLSEVLLSKLNCFIAFLQSRFCCSLNDLITVFHFFWAVFSVDWTGLEWQSFQVRWTVLRCFCSSLSVSADTDLTAPRSQRRESVKWFEIGLLEMI